MKTTHLVAALSILAASGSALANGEYTDPTAGFESTKSRAQVLAQVEQARDQGLLHRNGEIVSFGAPNAAARGIASVQQKPSTKTRSEVREALEQARADGLLDRNGEIAPPYAGA